MSRRAEMRRHRRAVLRSQRHPWPADAIVAVLAAWAATEADLPECRKRAHDQLIELMGDHPRGPVRWTWHTGDEAHLVLDQMVRTETSAALLDHYRRLRAHLREWGGYLVLAMAEARQ